VLGLTRILMLLLTVDIMWDLCFHCLKHKAKAQQIWPPPWTAKGPTTPLSSITMKHIKYAIKTDQIGPASVTLGDTHWNYTTTTFLLDCPMSMYKNKSTMLWVIVNIFQHWVLSAQYKNEHSFQAVGLHSCIKYTDINTSICTGGALTANSRALQTHLSYPACIARVISFWNFLA